MSRASRMEPGDARLLAMLTVLRDQLAPVVDQVAFGELTAADRRALARALRRVADALEPEPVVLVAVDEVAAERDSAATTP